MFRSRWLHACRLAWFVCAALPGAVGQESWTQQESNTTSGLWGVAYSQGMFVAVGENGTLLSSADGVKWTARTSGTNAWLLGIASTSTSPFVAVGERSTIITSSDARSWRHLNSDLFRGERFNGITFLGGNSANNFVAVGENGVHAVSNGTSLIVAHRSAAELGWMRGGVAHENGALLVGEGGIVSLADLNEGRRWLTGTGDNLEAIARGPAHYVAVGQRGAIWTSVNGSDWRRSTTSPSDDLNAVAFLGGTYAVAGARGGVWEAADPTGEWRRISAETTATLRAIAVAPFAAVAVGERGTIVRRTLPYSTLPRINSHPANVAAVPGGMAAFRVLVAPTNVSLNYQWLRNGEPIAGATRASLALEAVSTNDAGSYAVRVTNAAGSVTSASAALNLVGAPPPIVDPTVRADPSLQALGVPCALLSLPDGSLLVALAQNNTSTLVRLRNDGSLDPSFTRSTLLSAEPQLVRQPDGRIIVTGGRDTAAGQPMTFMRLEPDGRRDPSFAPADPEFFRFQYNRSLFDPPPNPRVTVQPDGKLLLHADWGRLGRLLSDGRLDPEFTPSKVGDINSRGSGIALMPDGRIYRGVSYVGLDRLLPNGVRDPDFRPPNLPAPTAFPGSKAFNLFLLIDGRVRINYQTWSGTTASSFAAESGAIQLLPDGTQDLPLRPGELGAFWLHAPLGPAGEILAGGLNVSDPASFGPYAADGVRRLPMNWGVATRDGRYVAAFAPDGRIWIGGDFTSYNGVPAMRIARLNRVAAETSTPPELLGTWAEEPAVNLNQALTLRVAVNSNAPVVYEWDLGTGDFFNAATIQRTTTPRLTVTTRSAGEQRWAVRAQNSAGQSTTLSGRYVVEGPRLQIVSQSLSVSAAAGRQAHLIIRVPPEVALNRAEWQRNGVPLSGINSYSGGILPAGEAGMVYVIPAVTGGDAGVYSAVLYDTAGQRVYSSPIQVTVDDSSRFVNLSVRAGVGGGEAAAIVGFVVAPGGRRRLLVRGIGPALANFGVAGSLPDPQLELFDGAGRIVQANDDWTLGASVSEFEQVGAFRLPAGGSKDAAMLPYSLGPGNYTVRVSDTQGRSGIGLVEFYEADNVSERLLNLSARVHVGAGEAAPIAGFVIEGPVPKRVLIRAAGPALATFGVSGALSDPQLVLRDSGTRVIAENNDWQIGADPAAPAAGELAAAAAGVGAFAFSPGSRDAAVVVTLPPGAYTVVVTGSDAQTGVALLELYELP